MRGDARIAAAQDGEDAVATRHGGTSRARLALVARRARVVEVEAPRALQEVAAVRGGVAQLRRRSRKDGAGQQRIAPGDAFVIGGVRIGRQRAQHQAAVVCLGD